MVLASGKHLRISWALGMHSHASGRHNTDLLYFTQASCAGCFFNSKVAAPSRRHAWRRKARMQVQMIGGLAAMQNGLKQPSLCAELRTGAPDEVVLKDRHAVVHVRAALAVGEPVEEAPEAQALGLLLLLALCVLEVAKVCAPTKHLLTSRHALHSGCQCPHKSQGIYADTMHMMWLGARPVALGLLLPPVTAADVWTMPALGTHGAAGSPNPKP